MVKKSYTVHLGKGLWSDALVAGLVRLGHHVVCLEDGPDDVYISQHAWRIPQGIAQMKMTEHIEMVMKQVRILEYANQADDQPQAVDKKPRSPASRKPKSAAGAGPASSEAGTPVVDSLPKPKRAAKAKPKVIYAQIEAFGPEVPGEGC
jgi:hypothetical protein